MAVFLLELNPDGLAKPRLVDRRGRAFIDNVTAYHGKDVIRQAKREVETLLDRHNGHGLLQPKIGDEIANPADEVWLDTLCRLIKQKKLRLCDARDSKLLLLPSRQIAATPVRHRLENWKQGPN
jgi:hypothetical protein